MESLYILLKKQQRQPTTLEDSKAIIPSTISVYLSYSNYKGYNHSENHITINQFTTV